MCCQCYDPDNSKHPNIIQEFANPLVRRHLQSYPEYTPNKLENATQAGRWLREVDGDRAAPMVRQGGKDFYVNEPCLVTYGENEESTRAVIPTRWYRYAGDLWAAVHALVPHGSGFAIDGRTPCEQVPLSAFLLNVLDLEDQNTRSRYGLPPQLSIEGESEYQP